MTELRWIKSVVKQQVDYRKLIHELMTIVLKKTIVQAVKKAFSQP